jgi:hypothetical protein
MRRTAVGLAGIAVTVALAVSTLAVGASVENPCRISQMRLAIGPLVSEKTEQHTATVTLTNLAPLPCGLDGYPKIKLFDSRGRVLPFIYSHRGDQMLTGAPPTSLHLEPKASAYFAFNKIACVTFADRYAQTLRVMLPGSPVNRSIQLRPHDRLIDYCQGSDTFRTVTVSAVVPTRAESFCRLQGSCGR